MVIYIFQRSVGSQVQVESCLGWSCEVTLLSHSITIIDYFTHDARPGHDTRHAHDRVKWKCWSTTDVVQCFDLSPLHVPRVTDFDGRSINSSSRCPCHDTLQPLYFSASTQMSYAKSSHILWPLFYLILYCASFKEYYNTQPNPPL